jgi:hypothetical protein
MRSSMRTVTGILLLSLILSSCATTPPAGTALTPEERAKAQKQCITNYTAVGAVTGALAGAAIGALTGGKHAQRALIGGAAGAVVGGGLAFALAWGHCMSLYSDLNSFPVAGAQETAQQISYNPSQGNVTKIQEFSVNPTGVAPGREVQLNGSYYVMAPEGTKEVKIRETRMVEYFDPSEKKWKELGAVDQEVTSALGTRKAEGRFDMPSDVPEGLYRITFKVSAQGKTDQTTRDLKVDKGLAMAPDYSPPRPQYCQVVSPS